MQRRSVLRVWLPVAVVLVLAVGGTLVGLAISGGTKSSAPKPAVTATPRVPISGGRATASGVAKPQHRVGVFASHVRPFTAPTVRRLRARVGDNETPIAPYHPVRITTTRVRVLAPRAPPRHKKRVRANVVGAAADVAVGSDAIVADPSSSQGTSTKEPSVAV